ncbi:MAG: hypothetical protein ACP5N3_02725 [Candidatus Nanoarchaeia archaeon]
MNVVLLGNSEIGSPENYQGIAIIKQALKEKGINVKIFPSEKFSPESLTEKSVVAIGAYYYELEKYAELSRELQNRGHFVVLGGHGTYFPKTNKDLLDSGAFNAINRGHAKPFIDFVMQYDALNPELIAEASGLATKDKPYVKKGEFPELKQFPLVKYASEFRKGVLIPSMRTCENHCDFCSEHILKTPDITDIIIESLKNYEIKSSNPRIFFGNPSFDDANINDIKKILSSMQSKPKVGAYLDSFQAGNPELIELMDELNITNVYLGLNAINNETAAYIGRRFKGNIVTYFEKEKTNVLNFLSTKRKVTGPEKYVISIMYSRADNDDAILDLIKFTSALIDIAFENRKKKIFISLNQTIPVPGTRFFKNHAEDYSINNYSDYSLGKPFNKGIITYDGKSNDFFERTLRARYYFMRGTPAALLMGVQNLIFAYEYVFEGKITQYLSKNKTYKNSFKDDIAFIKNPQTQT